MECRKEARALKVIDLVTSTEEMVEMPVDFSDPDMIHFEKMIRNTLCLMRCRRRVFGKERKERIEEPEMIVKQFEEKGIYNYLQLCYFQVRYFISNHWLNNSFRPKS